MPALAVESERSPMHEDGQGPARLGSFDTELFSLRQRRRTTIAATGHVINSTIGLNTQSFNQGGTPGLSTPVFSLEVANGAPPQSTGTTSLINNATEKVSFAEFEWLVFWPSSRQWHRHVLHDPPLTHSCRRHTSTWRLASQS